MARGSGIGLADEAERPFAYATRALLAACAFAAYFDCLPVALAETQISGAITGDAHWTLSNSPYVVTGVLSIANGAQLVIDGGVDVFMAAGSGLTVQSGSIQANGTTATPIRVLSDKTRSGLVAAPGDWKQWIFETGTVNTHLAHVTFEHGQGLVVHGSAPILDFVSIRDQRGAAITVDLAASLSGAGNEAIGNTLNAIVVPAGEISGTVAWKLRGIPYLVPQGRVSVGASPLITTVNPSIIQLGETLTVNLSGSRLLGAASAGFSNPGVTAQVLSGGTDTQLSLSVTAAANAAFGDTDLKLLVDSGEVTKTAALTVVRVQPKLTSVSPNSVLTGRSDYVLRLAGSNFQNNSSAELEGTALSTTFVSSTELQAALPAQTVAGNFGVRVRTPDTVLAAGYSLTDSLPLAVAYPRATASPSSVSLIEGASGTAQLTLPYPAPAGGLQFSLISSAPQVADAPASVSVAAGASSASFSIQARSVGSAVITISRSGWSDAQAQVTVIEPPRTLALTPITSSLVGVALGSAAAVPIPPYGPIATPTVGLIIGSAANSISPKAGVIGTALTLTVTGSGLEAVTQLSLIPTTGVTVGSLSLAADGRSLTVPLSLAADAPLGARRVSLRTAAGEILFVVPSESSFLVAAPAPELQSISPQVIEAGKPAVSVTVRGINLRDVTGLRFEPADGIAVVGSLSTSADATALTLNLQADAQAVSGPRTMIVMTAGGDSSATPVAGNTLYVARQTGGQLNSIAAPIVGIQFGTPPPPPAIQFGPLSSVLVGVRVGEPAPPAPLAVGPVAAPTVGIVVGNSITQVSPKAASVGTQLTLMVRGQGLDAVAAIALLPPDGVQVGAFASSADGTLLTVPLTLAADAPQTLRGLRFSTATGAVLPFANPADRQFLVAAPRPELVSIAPQVVVAGSGVVTLTASGSNLRDLVSARVEPAQGVAVVGTPTASADAASLQVSVQADADAGSGPRTLVVTTAGGESDATPVAGNSFQIARQTAGTQAAIASPVVGVNLASGQAPPTLTRQGYAVPIGVVLGGAVTAFAPAGAVKASGGSFEFGGRGLAGVTSARLTASDGGAAAGITLGTPVVNGDGSQVSVPYTVAGDAPSKSYRVDLLAGTAVVAVAPPGVNLWQVLDAPTISSVSPTVLQQGRFYTFTVRGQNLRNVQRIVFEPASGIVVEDGAPAYATDSLGEILSLRLILDPGATTGARVVRLVHPGGTSDAQATTANTINVVPP